MRDPKSGGLCDGVHGLGEGVGACRRVSWAAPGARADLPWWVHRARGSAFSGVRWWDWWVDGLGVQAAVPGDQHPTLGVAAGGRVLGPACELSVVGRVQPVVGHRDRCQAGVIVTH